MNDSLNCLGRNSHVIHRRKSTLLLTYFARSHSISKHTFLRFLFASYLCKTRGVWLCNIFASKLRLSNIFCHSSLLTGGAWSSRTAQAVGIMILATPYTSRMAIQWTWMTLRLERPALVFRLLLLCRVRMSTRPNSCLHSQHRSPRFLTCCPILRPVSEIDCCRGSRHNMCICNHAHLCWCTANA